MSSVAAELTVTGMVQGVGYRYFGYRSAFNLNLLRWIKNNPDGSVVSYVEGERGLIEEYIIDLKIGPPSASVRDIKIIWKEYTGKFRNFEIRR